MCGRFFLSRSGAEVLQHFALAEEPLLAPRYNIAPTQVVPLVRQDAGSDGRSLVGCRWGFDPGFDGRTPRPGPRPINARAETLEAKPLFRAAFAARRGLVPADGFYEWQHRGRSSRPFAVRVRDGALFAMAALWTRRHAPDGDVDSFAIVTTQANERIAAIHDRMPVIVAPADYAAWLDPAQRDPAALLPLLRPCPTEEIGVHPVDRRVNDVRCDDARLPEPERDLFSQGGMA
jgi:putative SOS response-associated peptidase YedK